MANYAVIFAGGVGSRMGSETPKQFLMVGDKPIIIHVLEVFDSHPLIAGIVVVCVDTHIAECTHLVERFGLQKVLAIIPGGDTGQHSIRNGIKYLVEHHAASSKDDIVLIHDGVRPLIDHDLISRSIACTETHGNSVAVSKAIETVIVIDDDGHIERTVDRSRCRNAKAPQCFRLGDIWTNHLRAEADGIDDAIDSATLMSHYDVQLFTTDCMAENIKITTPNDYYMFRGMYEARHSI